jgi:hypothetical protein
MELELPIKKEIGTRLKFKIHQFTADAEVFSQSSKSINLSLSGYIKLNTTQTQDLEDIYKVAMRKLKHSTYNLIGDVTYQLFDTIQERLVKELQIAYRAEQSIQKGEWGYFYYDMCIFLKQPVTIKDKFIQDKIIVFLELLVELLLDNQDFNFTTKKIKS